MTKSSAVQPPLQDITELAASPPNSAIIGYLTSRYARPSDTFIRGEVEALRELGVKVATFSIRRPADRTGDPAVDAERRSTTYLLEQSKPRWLLEILTSLCVRPRATFRATWMALGMSPGGVKSLMQHLVYAAEAVLLARFVRSRGVTHLHNHIAENSATVAMLTAELAGVPWSMTVHGPGIFFRPERWGLSRKIESASFVACITHFCRSQCMAFSQPQHWDKLKIVHCGVGKEFRDATIAPQPRSPDLVCVGRLCPEKGQALLVRAVAQLASEGRDVRLTLIGDGEDRELIERTIEENGLQDSVVMLGWQSSSQIRERLEVSRMLVLPSFAEGLPVVIMEALALGRPVISTYVAGIPELVKPGETGWLVPAGDVTALVNAMREALELSPDRLDAMGRAGRAAVAERHDVRTEAAKLARLFEAVACDQPLPGSKVTHDVWQNARDPVESSVS